MPLNWDRQPPKVLGKLQDELVRDQVRAVAAGTAYWRQRFADVGRPPTSISGARALGAVPAVGERDVSPTGDPAAMASIVVHGGEGHFATYTTGVQLRRALRTRAVNARAYRRIVESETRPTTFTWSGLGFSYPVASTRGDLDVVARTGARMWSVLGLSRQDALLAALPLESTPQLQALQYAAMAAGAPALFPGDDPDAVASAARLAPPSVFAAAPEQAGALLEELAGVGAPLSGLTTVLLVGRPTDEQRAAAIAAAARAGAANVVALSVYAPAGGRLLWAECRQSAGATGLHTYPDHDLVQVVDPETGEETAGAGELVLTQLGMRGTALLRWRTGDLVEGIDQARCAGCGRNVARILGLVPGVLVVPTDRGRNLDLRAVAGALTGRPDITDWRVVVGGRSRDGKGQVVVHVATSGDPGAVTVAAASDIRAVAGLLPTQLVAGSAADISAVHGQPLTRRILLRR